MIDPIKAEQFRANHNMPANARTFEFLTDLVYKYQIKHDALQSERDYLMRAKWEGVDVVNELRYNKSRKEYYRARIKRYMFAARELDTVLRPPNESI